MIRLQKWCSQLGVASRRECESWIAEGRLRINGTLATVGTKVDPDVDEVRLDGKLLASAQRPSLVYWMLNKPRGYLCSRKSALEMPTIFELPALARIRFKVEPVGRLDFLSEGLLLLTNDGELQNRLCHPSYKVERHYQVLSDKKLDSTQIESLRRGITLEDGPVKANVVYANTANLGASRGYWYFVSIKQGRNRIVRRIFESFGAKVLRLRRDGFGEMRLGSLKPGQIQQLSSKDIRYLKSSKSQGE